MIDDYDDVDYELLAKKFEDTSNKSMASLDFEKILPEQRLHENRRLCGLLKIYSLRKNPKEFDFCAEHDTLYLAQLSDLKLLTDDDVLYLVRCGVHYSTESDSLAMFC